MTQKDIKVLAEIIKSANRNPQCALGIVYDKLVAYCEQRNLKFDEKKFHQTCWGQ